MVMSIEHPFRVLSIEDSVLYNPAKKRVSIYLCGDCRSEYQATWLRQ